MNDYLSKYVNLHGSDAFIPKNALFGALPRSDDEGGSNGSRTIRYEAKLNFFRRALHIGNNFKHWLLSGKSSPKMDIL